MQEIKSNKISRRRFVVNTLGTAAVMSTAIPRLASARTTITMIGLAGHPSWQSTKDMVEAYKQLPQCRKNKIENMIVEHSHGVSIAARNDDYITTAPKDWNVKKVFTL